MFSDGPYPLDGGTTGFTWTNGTPCGLTTNTANGVFFSETSLLSNIPTGFQIQCPADTNPKRLKVYVGTSGAAGDLQCCPQRRPNLHRRFAQWRHGSIERSLYP